MHYDITSTGKYCKNKKTKAAVLKTPAFGFEAARSSGDSGGSWLPCARRSNHWGLMFQEFIRRKPSQLKVSLHLHVVYRHPGQMLQKHNFSATTKFEFMGPFEGHHSPAAPPPQPTKSLPHPTIPILHQKTYATQAPCPTHHHAKPTPKHTIPPHPSRRHLSLPPLSTHPTTHYHKRTPVTLTTSPSLPTRPKPYHTSLDPTHPFRTHTHKSRTAALRKTHGISLREAKKHTSVRLAKLLTWSCSSSFCASSGNVVSDRACRKHEVAA